jgi:CheY-like chemotaxis protein
VANILIVDDDIDLLKGQRLFLEGNGYTVKTAVGLKEGIDTLSGFRPDLIIADLMMENYDSGLVFCKKVKDNPELKNVPILMQTAAPREIGFTFDASNPEDREWLSSEEVLTKPVPLEQLLKKIKQALSKGRKDG